MTCCRHTIERPGSDGEPELHVVIEVWCNGCGAMLRVLTDDTREAIEQALWQGWCETVEDYGFFDVDTGRRLLEFEHWCCDDCVDE